MVLSKEEIKKYLPHRDPFLFVDEVVELKESEYIKAMSTFDKNSYFFQGHFPDNPVVPGVIILEAMAQVGGVLIYKSFEDDLLGKAPALVGIDKAKFKSPTFPDEALLIEAFLLKKKLNIFKISANAYKDEKLIVQAEITATVLSTD
ncbi:MAG: 3-hydroxyacyl-ACP dehydratase FabZ [Thermodesulfobacteriota bacterium]|nr:3-hydroxyacyl-ACP dehydratase FabZ [Thermodesulfobacteriota bacterium]MEE2974935.1 3-hydroxyacyl-ACP dehydratase FabZ [Thermodesulfobacteriota bacterium]|tara:strand:- start:120 stop:560 length:441 start_codon:yes stop_codon:yes gene_type:complete